MENPEILSVTFVDEQLGWAIYRDVDEMAKFFILARSRRQALEPLKLSYFIWDMNSFPRLVFTFHQSDNGWLVSRTPSRQFHQLSCSKPRMAAYPGNDRKFQLENPSILLILKSDGPPAVQTGKSCTVRLMVE
jgi:hypothetical protein